MYIELIATTRKGSATEIFGEETDYSIIVNFDVWTYEYSCSENIKDTSDNNLRKQLSLNGYSFEDDNIDFEFEFVAK